MPFFAQHVNVSLDYLVTLSVGSSTVLLCLGSFLGCGSKNCLAREGRVVTGLPSFVSLSSGILVLSSDVLVSENTGLVDSVQFSSYLWQEGKFCAGLLSSQDESQKSSRWPRCEVHRSACLA